MFDNSRSSTKSNCINAACFPRSTLLPVTADIVKCWRSLAINDISLHNCRGYLNKGIAILKSVIKKLHLVADNKVAKRRVRQANGVLF